MTSERKDSILQKLGHAKRFSVGDSVRKAYLELVDIIADIVQESHETPCDKDGSDLLVINLKDIDSVPEVYYKGRRVSDALVDIRYHYHTTGDETINEEFGINDMSMQAYNIWGCSMAGKDAEAKLKVASLDTVGHRRV